MTAKILRFPLTAGIAPTPDWNLWCRAGIEWATTQLADHPDADGVAIFESWQAVAYGGWLKDQMIPVAMAAGIQHRLMEAGNG